ncbi:MAG: hypothetical protein LBT86_06345 [Deltaproteobacteria bacterium]|jgi:hypothetical protein|nr:hypothetical protein [Deltaproteobacteria bacterium]
MKNWFRDAFAFTNPPRPPQPRTIKQLRQFDLRDPYERGVTVDPVEAQLLGLFEDEAIDQDEFDPRSPAAMFELLGEVE